MAVTMAPREHSPHSGHRSACFKDCTFAATAGRWYHPSPFLRMGKLGTERRRNVPKITPTWEPGPGPGSLAQGPNSTPFHYPASQDDKSGRSPRVSRRQREKTA